MAARDRIPPDPTISRLDCPMEFVDGAFRNSTIRPDRRNKCQFLQNPRTAAIIQQNQPTPTPPVRATKGRTTASSPYSQHSNRSSPGRPRSGPEAQIGPATCAARGLAVEGLNSAYTTSKSLRQGTATRRTGRAAPIPSAPPKDGGPRRGT